MTRNPILKVLSTMRSAEVQCLLMGGQACVLYGAAEFSRDTDFVVLAEPDNLDRLRDAVHRLQAETIAVPPFDRKYLERGHAVHFRCSHPEAEGMRIDVMAVLRGLSPFAVLWDRRTTVRIGSEEVDLLSLPDLVQAKKTQRDKDWPMIRRLIEADYVAHKDAPYEEQIRFWFFQARTPAILFELCERYPEIWRQLVDKRPVLKRLDGEYMEEVERGLRDEEDAERAKDRAYWHPLRKELEQLRRERR